VSLVSQDANLELVTGDVLQPANVGGQMMEGKEFMTEKRRIGLKMFKINSHKMRLSP